MKTVNFWRWLIDTVNGNRRKLPLWGIAVATITAAVVAFGLATFSLR